MTQQYIDYDVHNRAKMEITEQKQSNYPAVINQSNIQYDHNHLLSGLPWSLSGFRVVAMIKVCNLQFASALTQNKKNYNPMH